MESSRPTENGSPHHAVLQGCGGAAVGVCGSPGGLAPPGGPLGERTLPKTARPTGRRAPCRRQDGGVPSHCTAKMAALDAVATSTSDYVVDISTSVLG